METRKVLIKRDAAGTFVHLMLHDKRSPGTVRRIRNSGFVRSFKSNVEINGIKFEVYPYQNCHDRAIFCGNLFEEENDEFSFFFKYIKTPGHFIDIGANIGAICIPVAKALAGLKVIAIEPNPVNVKRLAHNVALNNLTGIEIFPYAIGPEGVLTLRNCNNRNSGQYSAVAFSEGEAAARPIEVRSMPLLSVLEKAQGAKISALKIDIEGFEDEALMPFFRDAVKRQWPQIISVEYCHSHLWKTNCIQEMINIGYDVVGKNKWNIFLVLR